jgi:hypothetical protein
MAAKTPEWQPQRGLTFEDVWATMQKLSQEADKRQQELVAQMKETEHLVKENAAQMKESKAEHDRMIAEMRAEMKELSENVGGINNSLGDMAEGLMASDLYETFEALGLDFDQFVQNYELKERKTKRTLAEVDMLLINGTIAMVVEVKTTMTRGDVDKHIKRMEILRQKPNSLFTNRKMYGAMASVKKSRIARQYARDKGFFVIELAGDTIKIDMPEGFKPKTW